MPETITTIPWKTSIDSKYRLVIVAARRSKQLQKGAKPRIHSTKKKLTSIALEEVQQGMVRYETIEKKVAAEEEE
ncbi:MAG: DNA-directed RNA polymerase subunit omega [Blastocatellia bacterium AA13]|nr:MAG: DNA-directed RNA polymerase subunit omega [Blastocatellia bacterium AA13]